MSKKKNKKKKSNNTTNNRKSKENNKVVEMKKSFFGEFINKKWVKIFIHIVSAYIWINFIVDMGTFTSRGGYPNPILSILALISFILEWNIIRPTKK